MNEILQKIRNAVDGNKTYITAVIGILTALVAWSGGELTDWQAITAVWIALQIIFIRSGNKKDVANQLGSINMDAANEIYNDGFDVGYGVGYEYGDEDARYEDE